MNAYLEVSLTYFRGICFQGIWIKNHTPGGYWRPFEKPLSKSKKWVKNSDPYHCITKLHHLQDCRVVFWPPLSQFQVLVCPRMHHVSWEWLRGAQKTVLQPLQMVQFCCMSVGNAGFLLTFKNVFPTEPLHPQSPQIVIRWVDKVGPLYYMCVMHTSFPSHSFCSALSSFFMGSDFTEKVK